MSRANAPPNRNGNRVYYSTFLDVAPFDGLLDISHVPPLCHSPKPSSSPRLFILCFSLSARSPLSLPVLLRPLLSSVAYLLNLLSSLPPSPFKSHRRHVQTAAPTSRARFRLSPYDSAARHSSLRLAANMGLLPALPARPQLAVRAHRPTKVSRRPVPALLAHPRRLRLLRL